MVSPSAIPRPITPTKTASYMTAYGFRSPKDHNEQLHSLKQTAGERDLALKELLSANLTLRTHIQRLEEHHAELEDRVLALTQSLRIKLDSLQSIEHDRVALVEQFHRDLALKKVELDTHNTEALNGKEKLYQAQMTKVMEQKRDELDQRHNLLTVELTQLQDQIANNDTIVIDQIETMRLEYIDKEDGLLKLMVDTKETVLKEIKQLETQKLEIESKILELQKEYSQLQMVNKDGMKHLQSLANDNSQLSSTTTSLHSKIEQLQRSLSTKKSTINELKQDIQWKIDTKLQLDQDLIQQEDQRRHLHNKLQNLKGSIRVFCRIRPKLSHESMQDFLQIQVPDNDEVKQDIIISHIKQYHFSFDKVFQQDSTNKEIFEEISQLVQSALYGFNVCIFAYGQTGSGKTFTMSNEDGIIPQSINQIFESCHKQKDWNYTISGEFLEIHNESIKDLLNDQSYKLDIKHTSNSTHITNLTQLQFHSPQEMIQVLNKALTNRSIASTNSNEHSSRSHTVCIIRLSGHNNKSESIDSVINLIDLAGSERISQSGVSGDRLKETQAINKSLSCLGDVIYALGENSKHIPFRNSKLTYLLQNSLTQDSKTLMFVNVSPLQKNLNETVNSLRFATKVNTTGLQRKV